VALGLLTDLPTLLMFSDDARCGAMGPLPLKHACSGVLAIVIIAGLESTILVGCDMNDGSSLRAIVDAAAELAQHEQRSANIY
jgi:hypothetical protein